MSKKNFFLMGLSMMCMILAGCTTGTPFQVSVFKEFLVYPEAENVSGLKLNIFSGKDSNLSGVDFGGLDSYEKNIDGVAIAGGLAAARHEVNGVAIGGAIAGSDNVLNGFTFGGVLAGAGKKLNGFAFGGLVAGAEEEINGVAFGSLFCGGDKTELDGVCMSAITSVVEKSNGLQMATVNYNQGEKKFQFYQLGVLCNYGCAGSGFQMGVVNFTEDSIFQLGVFNKADSGIQVGVLNWNKTGFLPWFPIFNY
ncbi:MAG: hypothetical protein NT118_01435 [Lentisphaerae bacterium]|nr:hypothetical protein [Lentisphaerota bacterium]